MAGPVPAADDATGPRADNDIVATRATQERRGRGRGLREIGVFAAAYLAYFGVRAISEGAPASAVANAVRLDDLERGLGIAWEDAVQAPVMQQHALLDVANWVYIFGHWPVLIAAGVLLFRYRPRHYRLLRDACLISGAVGLIIFAAFPVAPPRLAGLGVDTVTEHAGTYRTVLPSALVNEYAAMPSFHAGWNLLVGIVVFWAARHWAVRAAGVLMPVAMTLAVVATGNHFVVDVVVGAAIALAGLAAAVLVERRRATPRLDAGVHDRRPPAAARGPAPRGAVRRGPPCRQRPDGAAPRPGARARAGRG